MAKNFQTDNRKNTKDRNDIYNSEFESPIGVNSSFDFIEKNYHKWAELISFLRFYPDYYFDLIKEPNSKFELDLDQRVYMRCLARFPSNYVCVTRGYSKCVTGDTLLFTDKGIKEIGSYFDYSNDGKEFYTNHNINLIDKNGEISNSNKGVYSGFKKTKKITSNEGYQIETSLNHPLLTMNKNGLLEWKESSEINIGDYIVINRKNDLWGNDDNLDFDMNKWLNEFKKISKNRFIKHSCKTPKVLDEDFSLIIGYLIGDGTLTRDNTIILTNKDEDILNNYFNFMLNKLKVKISKKGKYDYVSCGRFLREYLRQIGLELRNSHTKEVPKCIMKSSKKNVSSFIKGLFDTDGTVVNSYVEYCTASEKLSKQVQTILLNFGIVSTRKKFYNNKYNTYHYKITIYGENIDIYAKYIGFSCKRKQDKMIKLCRKKRNTNKNIIPYQNQNMKKLYEKIKFENKYMYRKIENILRGCNDLTYYRLNNIVLNFKDSNSTEEMKTFNQYNDLNYFFSKVTTIEDSENHVYDIQVPNSSSFIGNGIVNHNTMIEVMNAYATACLFPGIKLSMIAETKDSSVAIWQPKHDEVLEFFPYMADCIKSSNFAKDRGKVTFVNGSIIDNMGVMQGVKGQRRHRGNAEEDNLITKKTFDDAVLSVFDIARTLGKIKKDPEELNGQINKFTTSGFRNSDAFSNMRDSYDRMKNLKGGFVWTADWSIMVHFGRQSRKLIDDRRETMSLTEFKQNYTCSWLGGDSNSLINITKLMSARKLKNLELEYDEKKYKKNKILPEYYIGIDIARKKHNRTAIVVAKVNKNTINRVSTIDIVNIITPEYNLTYEEQAIIIKRIYYKYGGSLDMAKSRVKAISIDINTWGQGVLEKLLEDQDDPITGENLGCFNTFNTDDNPSVLDAPENIYGVIATGSNNPDIIMSFVNYFEANKIKLFVDINNSNIKFSPNELDDSEILSMQVTEFIREVSNLRIPDNKNPKNLTIEQVKRSIDKDRYSALAYLLYYIKNFVDIKKVEENEENWDDYLQFGW